MTGLVIAILLTLGVSAICSLLEAFILSTTMAEIEGLKKSHPKAGQLLEMYKVGIDETSSAILTLNTIANTAGATIVGALAARVLESTSLGILSGGMVLGILFFSEIIPKNLGVAYRKNLQVYLVYPILVIRWSMSPLSYVAKKMLTLIMPTGQPTEEEQEEEIRLLAERSAQSGALSDDERDLISNALSLDDVSVESIMTPRTVVTFLKESLTVEEVCNEFKNIPFARIPIYKETIDEIAGIVRRRDILEANGEGKAEMTLEELKGDALFIPETASGLQALQLFMKKHQQIGVVVDEYGSTVGVITMEDVVEHLLGDEIYEESDMAVDMRELAKKRAERMPSATPNLRED
ncbi:HlyC/CorC family transporter [Puniceicoccales bacterium CK1056]|uniref:HlyC/CorC family transporter n=1 Tax=Oceanipulchritudo coccoides TaxID=2706888 RepID=A0A6B2M0L7_9BACT|nr:hemolysin family protein [Oceanipulchritudo coccoides]NDV61896.1 HlyC/CorC family transporter [Oceanipulchritudo coccoides]